MVKYFAYGSNMSADVISEVCPSHKLLGPARLKDHRLAFTRFSTKWGAGVADILPASGFVVWGVLYEIDENDVTNLDRKEGYRAAYTRIEVDVILRGGVTHRVITYTVISKESSEIPPSSEYLDILIEGARSRELKEYYIAFLESLKTEDKNRFREGFLVLGTESRTGAQGMGLLRIPRPVARRLSLGHLVVVVYRTKACLAKVAYVDTLDDPTCQVDQNIRHALGIPGRESYGACVSLHPVVRRELTFPFIKPRSLILPLHRPSWLDSEKNICVLYANNIGLLGLNEGEYVKIRVALLGEDGKYRIRKCALRVFSGSALEIKRGGGTTDYPKVDEIYLDLDGRTRLGIPKDIYDTPVVVSADIWKLFTSRLLYYGITLFLSMVALSPVVQEVMSISGVSRIAGFGITLLLSTVITLVLCLFDIRGKVQY